MLLSVWLVAALTVAAPADDAKYCALTFDDGPRPAFLDQALKVLDEKGVRATFFCVGTEIAEYPDWIKKVHAGGHEVENHSWNHPQLTKLSASGVRSQLTRTSDRIESLIGVRPEFVRPPYGANNGTTRATIEELGCSMALWDVDPYDWQGSATPNRTLTRILSHAHRNAVILMHEAQPTLKALPDIIDGLRKRGFTLVTYGELMQIKAGGLPPSKRVIEIDCGAEDGDGTQLAEDCGYALEVGLRALQPPGWVGDQKLSFRLLVPKGTTGTLQLALGGAADGVQQVVIDDVEVGEFTGAHRLSAPLSAADTADGEVLVEVRGVDGAKATVTAVTVDRQMSGTR